MVLVILVNVILPSSWLHFDQKHNGKKLNGLWGSKHEQTHASVLRSRCVILCKHKYKIHASKQFVFGLKHHHLSSDCSPMWQNRSAKHRNIWFLVKTFENWADLKQFRWFERLHISFHVDSFRVLAGKVAGIVATIVASIVATQFRCTVNAREEFKENFHSFG